MTLDFTPDHLEIERRVEALLFAAAAPLSLAEIARRLPEGADVGGDGPLWRRFGDVMSDRIQRRKRMSCPC